MNLSNNGKKLSDFLDEKMMEQSFTNEDLVHFIEQVGRYLNLETLPNYAVKHRFEYRMNQLNQNYNVKVEHTKDLDMVSAYNLEQEFLKEFKYYKYTPNNKFKGYTECLSVNPINAYGFWQEEQELINNKNI